MTFEVKQSITFVATHPLVILTKFGRNPIKHVEEEANCEKEEEEEEEELDLETDLDTVASVTSNDPRLTFDPIT